MGGIVGIKPMRIPKDGPPYEVPPESLDEQSKIGDQRFRSSSLQREVDAEVPIVVRIETGIGETDRVERRKLFSIHLNRIIQWKFFRVGLLSL